MPYEAKLRRLRHWHGLRLREREVRCNMTTNKTARSRGRFRVRSAMFRAVRLLGFGLSGWLWFISSAGSAWRAVSLAAVLAVAALVGVTWYLSNVRATRAAKRFNAALVAYAALEAVRGERLKEIA